MQGPKKWISCTEETALRQPIGVATMTMDECHKTVDAALMFLGNQRKKTVKGRMVYNGKPTQECLLRKDSTSPTATLKSIILTVIV
jgi:hypothetical protein